MNIPKPEIVRLNWDKFIQNLLGIDEWVEENKKKFLLKHNIELYNKLYVKNKQHNNR